MTKHNLTLDEIEENLGRAYKEFEEEHKRIRTLTREELYAEIDEILHESADSSNPQLREFGYGRRPVNDNRSRGS